MSQTTPLSQESSDHAHKHHQPGFIGRYIFSTDHKVIGIQTSP